MEGKKNSAGFAAILLFVVFGYIIGVACLMKINPQKTPTEIISVDMNADITDEELQKLLQNILQCFSDQELLEEIRFFISSEEYQELLHDLSYCLYLKADDSYMTLYDTGYLYFGDLKDLKKEGTGIWIKLTEDYLDYYEGEWKNDKPNGWGTLSRVYFAPDGSRLMKVITEGTYKDGKENGQMSVTVLDEIHNTETYQYTASNGLAATIEGYKNQFIIAYSEENPDKAFIDDGLTEHGIPGFISGKAD